MRVDCCLQFRQINPTDATLCTHFVWTTIRCSLRIFVHYFLYEGKIDHFYSLRVRRFCGSIGVPFKNYSRIYRNYKVEQKVKSKFQMNFWNYFTVLCRQFGIWRHFLHIGVFTHNTEFSKTLSKISEFWNYFSLFWNLLYIRHFLC